MNNCREEQKNTTERMESPATRLRPPPVAAAPPLFSMGHSLLASSSSSFSPKRFPFSVRAASGVQERKGEASYRGPKPRRDFVTEWVSNNDAAVRRLPISVGAVSLLAVLVNRAISGIAPVADASSSQSRTDILAIILAVTHLLTGLVWLSIQPKSISPVIPKGIECSRIYAGIPDHVVTEILWAWDSLSAATCCRSLVIVYRNNCLLQIGIAAESSASDGDPVTVDTSRLIQGSLYQGIMKSGKQSYLANLSLYPGRSELPFLPLNTQAVILQPLDKEGIIAVGGDTIRGFTSLDQAWITLIAEKLEATLSNSAMTRTSGVQNI